MLSPDIEEVPCCVSRLNEFNAVHSSSRMLIPWVSICLPKLLVQFDKEQPCFRRSGVEESEGLVCPSRPTSTSDLNKRDTGVEAH